MEFIKFYKQRRISHKYVRWLYNLLEDGRFHLLEKSKRIKGIPNVYNSKRDGFCVDYFNKMYYCGTNLTATVDWKSGHHNLHSGKFCQDRICPICCVRKSIREYSKLTFQMESFGDKYTYYFLTLTLPNNPFGFKDELDILTKILTELGDFVGFQHNKNMFRFCEGLYGSYEITKSDYGWHPHLHIVLAYPKEYIVSTATVKKNIRGRERVFENGLSLRSGSKTLFLSQDKIMEKYIQLIRKYTDVYNERLEDFNFLNIGFQPCYNIDQGVNEMAKYLIDFEALQSADDLFVYLRDSYRKKQRVRRGCFLWTDDVASAHRDYLEKYHLEQNLNFIQSRGEDSDHIYCADIEWHDDHYTASRLARAEIPIMFTNLTTKVIVKKQIDIIPVFDIDGKFVDYVVIKLPDLIVEKNE